MARKSKLTVATQDLFQNNYNGKKTTINDILSFKNSLNNKNSKHRANEASCNTTNLDENRSINESYNPSLKLTFDNYQDYPVCFFLINNLQHLKLYF